MANKKKVFGDGKVIELGPGYSDGLGNMYLTRDAFVAVCEEIQDLYDMVEDAADFDELKAAMSARGPLQFIKFNR